MIDPISRERVNHRIRAEVGSSKRDRLILIDTPPAGTAQQEK